ncbi:putative nucleic acid-binding protein [Kineosphaera limosa]|uniref:Ribonuclease VapC n=1 Tax=Kineosphaera limosa NBRC 100340 TaxID=1184609 RepID=K6WPS8_9MICO|nr:type II toxin-antitoxin system VapC family toxin [Kineosphaera limosa]NYE00034.1 putative nucleic acid-binding protein [Kineosphaera limosa]GAB95791.1 hypothetical protein KILIM_026_00620 [Kineosphaera limosa NBRC 100340]
MDAFDADVLIYAAVPGHPLGSPVRALLAASEPGVPAGIGSTLLLPELLIKPVRTENVGEVQQLTALVARLDLLPCDAATARLAVALGARYALRAADAVHLATAVHARAERFVTNNRKDFPETIGEIAITYPDRLSPPS